MEQMQLFPLSEAELKDRSKTMAEKLTRYNAVEREAKEVAGEYKKTLKSLRAEMTQLADVVTHEEEWREYTPPWSPRDAERGVPDADR